MMTKDIPVQKAVAILKMENKDYIEAKVSGQETLLKTGAKLVYTNVTGWYIRGYAYDGRDTAPYL